MTTTQLVFIILIPAIFAVMLLLALLRIARSDPLPPGYEHKDILHYDMGDTERQRLVRATAAADALPQDCGDPNPSSGVCSCDGGRLK